MKKKALPKGLRLVPVSRYEIDVFVQTYLHFMMDNGIGAAWDRFEQSQKKANSVEDLISAHSDLQNVLLQNSFIQSSTIFARLNYMASIISGYIVELKKWMKSVENEVTETESAIALVGSVLQFSKKFQQQKKKLIDALESEAQKNVDTYYSNFVVALGFSSHSTPLYMA